MKTIFPTLRTLCRVPCLMAYMFNRSYYQVNTIILWRFLCCCGNCNIFLCVPNYVTDYRKEQHRTDI